MDPQNYIPDFISRSLGLEASHGGVKAATMSNGLKTTIKPHVRGTFNKGGADAKQFASQGRVLRHVSAQASSDSRFQRWSQYEDRTPTRL